MGRKHNHPESSPYSSLGLLVLCLVSCGLIYVFVSAVLSSTDTSSFSDFESSAMVENGFGGDDGECCRGIENLELWGTAVKWGTDFKFNSSELCCKACKSMCTGTDGPCLCDTWVFCGNKESCGSKFGECWLKKQKDNLRPEKQDGVSESWTSGLIFGKGEGIIGMKTEYGILRIKLFPDCAPHSVQRILQLLALRHCAGCHFYRAEGRGQSWDAEGNHIKDTPLGPPFALIQGTLEVAGEIFGKVPIETCPTIRKGSVAWINSGPEFFISLAHHEEWKHAYTVFGSVLPEDMKIAEKIAELPTKSDVWNNIQVSVLEKQVPILKIEKAKLSNSELSTV